MPARVAPDNEHLDLSPPVGSNAKEILKVFPEDATYKLLIEAYRVSDEDSRVAAGRLDLDKGNPRPQYITGHSFNGLKEFITKAEQKGTVLPSWWNVQKREQSERIAREMYHWSDIETTVPKEIDDMRRFGGPGLRLPLRMLASEVTGQLSGMMGMMPR